MYPEEIRYYKNGLKAETVIEFKSPISKFDEYFLIRKFDELVFRKHIRYNK
jgi:hypothetical protein